MKVFKLTLGELAIVFQIRQDAGMDDAWQEIIQDHVLVMKPDDFLDLSEVCVSVDLRMVLYGSIMESQE